MAMVRDLTAVTCKDLSGRKLLYRGVEAIIIHRCSLAIAGTDNLQPIPDEMLDGFKLAESFRRSVAPPPYGLGTYGRIPYHAVVTYPTGVVQQILPLGWAGAHCIRWNNRSFGIAVIGDTDKRPCTPEQWKSLVECVGSLSLLNSGLEIYGHDSAPGGEIAPGKRCPGSFLSVDTIRAKVYANQPIHFEDVNDLQLTEMLKQYGWRL